MPWTTYFVVQPFIKSGAGGTIRPGDAFRVATQEAAERAVSGRNRRFAGVIAFSRSGDPSDDGWDEAVVIGMSGEVLDQADADALPW